MKNNNKKKILVFGHIPKEYSGQQSSGLSYAMWDIANSINKVSKDYEVLFAATDIFEEFKIISNTKVYGWRKKTIIKYILINPKTTFHLFFSAIEMNKLYNLAFLNSFIKLIFYSYANEIPHDLVHIHGPLNLIFYKKLKSRKLPVVGTIHGIAGFDKNIPNYKVAFELEKIMNLYQFDLITFISSLVQNEWIKSYGTPICQTKIIFNGYSKDTFYLSTNNINNDYPNKIVLLTVGGISKLKGQERIINALINVKNKHKFKVKFAGVGKFHYINKLKEKVREHNLDVTFLGYKSHEELGELYQSSHYFILPSSTEGFGLVFIESIACGLKVILPKALPIYKEKSLLNEANSIGLEDCTEESIIKVLENLDGSKYDRELVAKSVKHLAWENIVNEYINEFKKIV